MKKSFAYLATLIFEITYQTTAQKYDLDYDGSHLLGGLDGIGQELGHPSDLGGFRFRNRVTKRMVDPALDSGGAWFYRKDSPFRFTKRSGFGGNLDNRFRFADYDLSRSSLFRLRPLSMTGGGGGDAFRFNKRAMIGNGRSGSSSEISSNFRRISGKEEKTGEGTYYGEK